VEGSGIVAAAKALAKVASVPVKIVVFRIEESPAVSGVEWLAMRCLNVSKPDEFQGLLETSPV